MRFSDRMGLTDPRKAIQLDGMDDDLRIDIYNMLYVECRNNGLYPLSDAKLDIWARFWKRPLDETRYLTDDEFMDQLKGFIIETEWYDVYNLVEFYCNNIPDYDWDAAMWLNGFMASDPGPENLRSGRMDFESKLNGLLERNASGYRMIECLLVPISDEAELSALEEALCLPETFDIARSHVAKSLEKLSEKPVHDLRNAVNEAVSAVESVCRLIVKSPSATLGGCIKELRRQERINGLVISALDKIWEFSSKSTRHAGQPKAKLIDYPTAKYIVVSCAASVNLLAMHYEELRADA